MRNLTNFIIGSLIWLAFILMTFGFMGVKIC